jgi:hypothetical protein
MSNNQPKGHLKRSKLQLLRSPRPRQHAQQHRIHRLYAPRHLGHQRHLRVVHIPWVVKQKCQDKINNEIKSQFMLYCTQMNSPN